MPNFSIPLSGLIASNTALATVSDNLANLNTTGYKESTVHFQDLFYNLLGTNRAADQIQIGSGVSVASANTNFSNGAVQNTGVSTDVAITGNGFFVVQDGSNTFYTRAGNFTTDSNGYLMTTDGYRVMGYPATNGTVNTLGGLTSIQMQSGMLNPPNATSEVSIRANLSAEAAVGDSYNTSITVYDSLGSAHVLNIGFTRTASGWDYDASLPSSEISGASGATTSVGSGSLSFDSDGHLTDTTPIAFSIASFTDGASTLDFNWNLASPSGDSLLTQLAGSSSTSSTSQDGNSTGTLTGFSINGDGTITGNFTNGFKTIGQIALANFGNLQGLTKMGSNNYAATLSSGSAVVGTPGTSSLGTLTGSALELANVDMSTEFANLIVAERAFQANAKSVTTFDQIANDTLAMVR